MPMSITPSKTPKGKPYLHMVSSGLVTASDAEGLTKAVGPGGPHTNLPILASVQEGASFSPEARQAFTRARTPGFEPQPVAVVVTSAPLRVMLSFVVRISGAADHTKFFASDADGLAWLDERPA